MKIIAVDNYDRESVSDILVCGNVHKYYGEDIVKILNEKPWNTFFKLVSDEEKLYKFEP